MSLADPADIFRQEAADLLDRLETTLLDLGQFPGDRDLVDTAFRALHTIKGSGAMFGFDQVASFTHDFETAFDLIRQGKVAASHELVAVALAAKDYIRTLIEDPDATDSTVGRGILADLQRLVSLPKADVTKTDAPSRSAMPAPEAPAPCASAEAGWRLRIRLDPGVLRNGTNPLALLDELCDLGPCTIVPLLDALPELEDLDPETIAIGWDVTLVSTCDAEAIESVFMFVSDDMKLTMTPLADAMPTRAMPTDTMPADAAPPGAAPAAVESTPQHVAVEPAAPTPVAETAPAASDAAPDRREAARRADDRGSSSVRVQAERLDELMDRVGELVIAQARLSQLAGSRQDAGVKAIAEDIERLASRLRDTTMGIRMVPIGSLFGRFRRLIHDLSRDLGKPVDFVTAGEETELDKTMIERLADPLVHLIRNAIDHGIEQPERRAAAGKGPTGRIELRAEHVGTQVQITVQDDGGGLDVARIRAKAEENGLVAPGAPLSDQEIYQFLFHPGFSTAKTVSALSGRGVGMDVVKKTLESMRGTIDLATVLGRGSSVVLRLPLTLAIIEGLLIRVGDARYIIPLSAIEECVELPAGDREARGRDLLAIRGDLVPFLRLRDVFEAGGEPDPHQKVIITTVGDARVGLVADQIIGSHQTVIKSLSKLHADVDLFSGATILGDGTAALILDIARLIAAGQSQAERDGIQEAA